MKSNQILFAIASILISTYAHAQADGSSNGVSTTSRVSSLSTSQKSEVDRFLDAERKKNEAAYKNLFTQTDGQSPVIVLDLRSVTDQNIDQHLAQYQRSLEQRFGALTEVPDSFAISIQNAARIHHSNKIIELVMKEADKHKKKLEAKARLQSQNATGTLAAGSSSAIENAGGSNNLEGKFSVKAGLGDNKKIMLVWKKKTMTW